MSTSLSISLFFVVAMFYIMIIDVFTMLYKITGMTEEKARFQVISLLTNSGYTTKESEVVVNVLARRKLARTIMLFGYVFSVTIVSVFVNMMIALPNYEKEELWPVLIVVSSLFVGFMIVKRIPRVRALFNSKLERIGRKWIYGKKDNAIILLDEFPKGVIVSVKLDKLPQRIAGKTLDEIALYKNYGIKLIFIRRGDVMMIELSGDIQMMVEDTLVLFGARKNIEQLFGYETHLTASYVPADKEDEAVQDEKDVPQR